MTRARQIFSTVAISSVVAILGLMWVPGQTVGQLSQVMAKLGMVTVGTEPSTLTAAEIEKVILLERSNSDGLVEPLPVPAGVKPPDKCTIEIGPPGLNAVEIAKANRAGPSAKAEEAGASAKANEKSAGAEPRKGQ